ncbi:MAG: glycine cleavage system protein H [Symbiobacteriaceae bacterium]|nr:glycine cleavage system protein H [Symbiobacteriaceae bacterium]
MGKTYAVLPCNGLDKCAGCVTREIALQLSAKTDNEIICPVFYRVAEARYNRLAQEKPLLVIDGCATRCASKLAAEKRLKITERLNVSDYAKEENVTLGAGLSLDADALGLVRRAVTKLLNDSEKDNARQMSEVDDFFPSSLDYEIYKKDKFIFRLPTNEGFYFNENDVWAYVSGNRARVGVTDYVQKSLSDIMFFTPPAIGAEIVQFDELGVMESGKAIWEIISPVSGVVTAINEKLINAPEMLNQNPYEQGWVAEIDLTDFDEDSDLLHVFDGYMSILKRKVDEYRVKD